MMINIHYGYGSYYTEVLLVYHTSFITSAIIITICLITLWPTGLLYQYPPINQLVFVDLTSSATI